MSNLGKLSTRLWCFWISAIGTEVIGIAAVDSATAVDWSDERETADAAGCTCTDGNQCTTDVCTSCFAGFCLNCSHSPVPNGTPCGDGIFCNGLNACDAGVCVPAGDPCPGPDGDSDCSESCDETFDNCNADDPGGSTCDDGLFCNGADACSGGVCQHTGNPCPGPDGDDDCVESCDEIADACTANDPDGSMCNDGVFCNGMDLCGGGECLHSGDPCSGPDGDEDCSESCNESSADCTANDPDGSACTDSVFCNGPEVCEAGNCNLDPANPCGEGTLCVGTACVPATGACCIVDGCESLDPKDCTTVNGQYLGDNSYCCDPWHCSQEVLSNHSNIPIPDDDRAGVSSLIHVARDGLIVDVDVDLVIEHTWVGDLVVTLEHVGYGLPITLMDPGCSLDDYNIVLDDDGAGGPIDKLCSASMVSPPTYTPSSPLSVFNAESTSGDWILRVYDLVAEDQGTLLHWSLRISVVAGECAASCPTDLNNDGTTNAADLALLLGAWGANPGHAADFNDDNLVNASDLALLLGGWGACP